MAPGSESFREVGGAADSSIPSTATARHYDGNIGDRSKPSLTSSTVSASIFQDLFCLEPHRGKKFGVSESSEGFFTES
jgi:hypothetical protein